MNELETFPVEQFYEALMSTSGLQEKLENILREINANSIQMTYQAIVQIHHILNSKLQPPLMKFNALNCTKILFDTCQYSVTLLIEVYLLPIIFQIAAFKATKKSQQGLSLYFIQRGLQPTKQVKRLGYNFVSLAVEFIYVSAQVKMFRVLQNVQLQQESNYKKISKALKMRGVPLMTTLNFYNQSYIQQTRRLFLDKLHLFNPEKFINFFTDLVYGQITQGKRLQLDSKRLIMFGDVFIISPLVDRIEDQLNQIDGNFPVKTKALTLLFQFIRFGYAEAILLLNNSEFLPNIVSQIEKVQGDKDMDEGRWIYQKLNDNQKDKKVFYLEFLRYLEIWSHAVPFNQFNEQSDAKRLFQYLKFQKKFKFPQNPNVHKYKSQMQIYLRQNAQRNEKVIQIIENNQSVSVKSRYKISSLKDESNIKTKKRMQFQDLQQIVINTMRILQIVGFSQKRYDKDMKKLLIFNENWHNYVQAVKRNIQYDQQPFNLDMLISEGEIVYGQILQLEKIYKDFKSNRISFQNAQEKITQFFNQFQNQNLASQVSVSAKSKNTLLTNRRDLRSKISFKARNDKSFSDHSKNSYISNTKSARSNFRSVKNPHKNNRDVTKQKFQNNGNFFQVNQTFAVNNQPKVQAHHKKQKSIQNDTNFFPQEEISKHSIKNYLQNDFKQPQILKMVRQQTADIGLLKNSDIYQKISQKISNSSLRMNQVDYIKLKEKSVQKFIDSFPIESSFKNKSSLEAKFLKEKQIFSNVDFEEDSSTINALNSFRKQVQNKRFFKGLNGQQPEQNKRSNKRSKLSKILSSDKVEFLSNQESKSQNSNVTNKKSQKNFRQKSKKKSSNLTSKINENISGYFNRQSVLQYGLVQQKSSQKVRGQYNLQNQHKVKKGQSSLISQKSQKSIKIKKSNNPIKNLEGSSRLKQKEEISSIKKEQKSNLMQSKSFHLNDSQKLQKSQLIKVPNESFEMLESYYKTSQIQNQKLQQIQQIQSEKNFVETFEIRRQVIHSPNKILGFSNHQNEQKPKNRIQNLLQAKGLNLKSSRNKKNIMQVLSERSAKRSIYDYMMQKQKNKLIKNLNHRIKLLENQQHTIKTKLSKKDQQIHSMSYKNYSQKHNVKFKKSQNTQMGSQNFRENQQSNTSLAYQLKINSNDIKSSRSTNQLLVLSKTKSSKQSYVDLSQYQKFFNHYKNDFALKKNCLRNKSLILSNDDMEIGCMSLKKDSFINFTLFITPKKISIVNVKFQYEHNQNLRINIFPETLYSIKMKRQQSVNIKIVVQNVPFSIPKLKIHYEIEKQEKKKVKNQALQTLFTEVTLPFTFNKICLFNSLSPKDFYEMFNSEQSQNSTMSIKKFRINQKIFNEQKVKQYFPYLTVIKKKEQLSTGKLIVNYGFEANYNGNVFLVLFNVEDKKYASFQTKNMTGQKKTEKFMQFFISTFKFLLSN